MKLEIISMTPQERMYSYSQSSQIEAQTGCIWRYQSTGGRNAGRLHVWLADTRRRSQELR